MCYGMLRSMKIFSLCVLVASLGLGTAQAAPKLVEIQLPQVPAGSIVVDAKTRSLYLKVDEETAIFYRVAVAKPGMEWSGATRIKSKHVKPAWIPPSVVRESNPNMPGLYEAGAENNPMGAAAMILGIPEIAIHGTNSVTRKSIGTAASFGCIRMLNEDITDLFRRVNVGTLVVMYPSLP